MGVMREYPGVEIIETVIDDDDGKWAIIFLIDNVERGSRARDVAEVAIREWCVEHFGPPAPDGDNTEDWRWYMSPWSAVSFYDKAQAFEFKMRWF